MCLTHAEFSSSTISLIISGSIVSLEVSKVSYLEGVSEISKSYKKLLCRLTPQIGQLRDFVTQSSNIKPVAQQKVSGKPFMVK